MCIFQVLRREAAALAMPGMDAWLRGERGDLDGDAMLLLAAECESRGWEASRAKLLEDCAALQPNLRTSHGISIAMSELLAGCGVSVDAGQLDETGRSQMRAKAMQWLNARLDMFERGLQAAPQEVHNIHKAARLWQVTPAIAVLRNAEVLATLPAEEQTTMRAFRDRFEALLRRHD
jgi:hypothetical protein